MGRKGEMRTQPEAAVAVAVGMRPAEAVMYGSESWRKGGGGEWKKRGHHRTTTWVGEGKGKRRERESEIGGLEEREDASFACLVPSPPLPLLLLPYVCQNQAAGGAMGALRREERDVKRDKEKSLDHFFAPSPFAR